MANRDLKVTLSGDASQLQREMAKGDQAARKTAAAIETLDKMVQQSSRSHKGLTDAQKQQVAEQARATQETKRQQAALRQLGLSQRDVNDHVSRFGRNLGTARKRAEETVATNAALTGSFKSMARQAVTAGVGFAAAYVGISKAKDAVKTTTDLAHETGVLHKITGMSIKSSSDWAAMAQVRGIASNQLGMAYTKLSTAFLKADAGNKASVQTMKALGISQADVHRGAGDLQFAMFRTADALHQTQSETVKNVGGQALLGRSWRQLIPVLGEGSKGLKDQLALAKAYHVELTGNSIKDLDKLKEKSRELQYAQLGLKVQFTEDIAPALIKVAGAAGQVIKTFDDPKLSGDEKWKRISNIVGPLATQLEHGAEQAIPHIADAVGRAAPQVAGAFVHGFANADVWGKLALGAFAFIKLRKLLPGMTAIGRAEGAAMGTGMAEGAMTGGVLGRLRGVGGRWGGVLGGVAAGVITAKVIDALQHHDPKKAVNTAVNPLGFGMGDQPKLHGGPALATPPPRRLLDALPPSTMIPLKASAPPLTAATIQQGLLKTGAWRDILRDRDALRDYGATAVQVAREISKLNDVHGVARTRAEALYARVQTLTNRLSGLRKGTGAYNDTAADLRRTQDRLAKSLDNTTPAASHAASGLSRVGDNAGFMGGAVGKAGQTVANVTNSVLKSLDAKPVHFDVGAASQAVSGAAGAVSQTLFGKARGGFLPGTGMMDTVPVLAAPDEFFATRHQQGPIEMGLAVSHAMGMQPYPSLRALETLDRPHYAARGGYVQKAKGGHVVGSTTYGGPGDPSSGTHGYRGDDLTRKWDSFAELKMGTALGGLPYMAGLKITAPGGKSITAYKRDIGFGQGSKRSPGGHSYDIDLWYMLAQRLGLPAVWSGDVGIDGGVPGGSAGAGAARIGVPKIKGPKGPLLSIARGATSKMGHAANAYLATKSAKMTASAGTGAVGGGLRGPKGVGTWNGIPVANWLVDALKWAKAHGGNTQITSGYRPGFDPFAPGGSEHAGTQYPHGAIDFGGFHDPTALAHKLSFLHSLSGYRGPKPIMPIGFTDDGHTSGTGHARGGFVRRQRGGFVGKQSGGYAYGGDGGSIADVIAARVNPFLSPKPPKGHRGHKPPKPSTHVNPITHHIETHTAAEWQAINNRHALQAHAQADARKRAAAQKKHEQQVLQQFQAHITQLGQSAAADYGAMESFQTSLDESHDEFTQNYELTTRRFDLNMPDLTTAAGRTQRIADLRTEQLLGRMGAGSLRAKRTSILGEANRARKLIKQLSQQARHAPKKARPAIQRQIAGAQRKILALRKAAAQVGIDIGNSELDALDIDKQIQDVEKQAPTAADTALAHLNAQAALAALTPDTADDVAAAQGTVDFYQGQLAWAQKTGDDNNISQAAQNLKSAQDNLASLQQAGQQQLADNTAALKDLADQMKRSNDIAAGVVGTDAAQIAKSFADLMNGQLVGYGLAGRQLTAGAGQVARY